MRKRIIILILGVLFFGIGLGSLSFAQGMDGEMGKENMGMCSTHGMMMKKSIVGTADGGVIVLVGNKLVKYDKDLNMQKEVEIKIDMGSMNQQMGGCPMMKCGKMDTGMSENNSVNKAMPAQGIDRKYHNKN